MKKLLITGALLLAVASQSVLAVPARRDVVRTITQPDGSVLQVRLVGDEKAHCFVTADDNTPVLADASGHWRFATIGPDGQPVASAVSAANLAGRSAAQKAFVASLNIEAVGQAIFDRSASRFATAPARQKAPARAATTNKWSGIGTFDEVCFPSDGVRHALVILVQFSDTKFTVKDPGAYYDRFLNKEGFDEDNATGSVRDFYIKSSAGNFKPTFDVYGPVTLTNKVSYYGQNDTWGNDLRATYMVKEACEKLDSEINFANYDLDGDGEVDNVYVIYAGQGEADYGSATTVWPHRWYLSGDRLSCTLDDTKIENYGCCNEWSQFEVAGIGTFCHEFGHVMGLPDLYSTSYNDATYLTPGSWSAMDYGPYLNDGHTPPTFSAFERNALGWIDLTEIKPAAASLTLRHIEDTNQAFIIPTADVNEFFLLENRQQKGWDKFLPGHGMLIWHIQYKQSAWTSNAVNNTAAHQYVDIEEANNLRHNQKDAYMAGYPFPGTARNTEFTDDSTPNMKTWSGKTLGTPITNIEETDGIITFDVCGGYINLTAPVVKAKSVTPAGFSLAWDAVEGAATYAVSIMDQNRSIINRYADVPVDGLEFTADYLDPESTYFAQVRAIRGQFSSDPSDEVSITTADRQFAFDFTHNLGAEAVSQDSFTATWLPVKDAVDYRLTVLANTPVEGGTEVCDFGSGSSFYMPEGWTSSTTKTYSDTYAGKESPSLKMGTHADEIMTPLYTRDIVKFQYWSRGANAQKANYIEVEGRTGEDAQWQLLHTLQPLVLTAAGVTTTISNIPAGIHQVRLVYHKKATGNASVDDIVVTLGGIDQVFLTGYEDRSVGNTTSHTVTGIDPAVSDYYFTVQAVDASGSRSLVSPKYRVSVNGDGIESGVVDITAAEAELFDLQGRRVINPSHGIYIRREGSKVTKVVL